MQHPESLALGQFAEGVSGMPKQPVEIYKIWVIHCEDCGILRELEPESKAEAAALKKQHQLEHDNNEIG